MSTVRLLVLGTILRRGVTHGYGVHQDLTSWRADTWTSVKPGSIYHALEKLEAQGMIMPADSGNPAKLGPSRTEYMLTEQGKTEFQTLLENALKSNDLQQLAAGIAFMEMLPRQHVISILEERLIPLNQSVAFLKTLPTEPIPSDPSKHPELVGMWIGYMEYVVSATRKLLQSLHAGKYKFIDEITDGGGEPS
ncbi:PadR family transcriptional regulator [Cohnella sp. CFH 77786]|uniref:PadR family transcriptional regulator n=1 Tax=Cohnella sp. CFH 77786 TaxID=2662265 RepID=UPI001C60B6E6|nr:PadR family transcriptional regulator [Cohnella sp. CFH 77786]